MTQITAFIDKDNDCSGYFGNGANCKITAPDDLSSPKQILAEIMVKFDYDENETDSYNSASASDFSKSGNKSGSWSYTPSSGDFTGVKFWAAKAGNGFNLFWMVDDGFTQGNNPACNASSTDNTNFNFACMSLAQTVTSGDWLTPSNKGLSHLTFYGDRCTDPDGCFEQPVQVPEPSTIVILLTAIGLLVRTKKSHLRQG